MKELIKAFWLWRATVHLRRLADCCELAGCDRNVAFRIDAVTAGISAHIERAAG